MFTTGRILIYSTWIVWGIFEVVLGVERLTKSALPETPWYGLVTGIMLLVFGVVSVSLAGKLARVRELRLKNLVRSVTVVIFLFEFGIPAFLAAVYSVAILIGQAEVNALYKRNLMMLGSLVVAYAVAIAWARWRLKCDSLDAS